MDCQYPVYLHYELELIQAKFTLYLYWLYNVNPCIYMLNGKNKIIAIFNVEAIFQTYKILSYNFTLLIYK